MMNKKDLKMYEAPACEVVELEMSQVILSASATGGGSEDMEFDPDFGQ